MPRTRTVLGEVMRQNLVRNTGKSLEAWLAEVREQKFTSQAQADSWLRRQKSLGPVTAAQLSGWAFRPANFGEETPEELLAGQFRGAKAELLPLYDRLVLAVQALGPDTSVSPRATFVSLRRNQQFGIIRASTNTRIDLGLRLPTTVATARLVAKSVMGGGIMTHRVGLSAVGDVDKDVLGWLKAAYSGAR